mmetsp:Transcript_8788/g.53997  ORF Transcript_8788/g.53997 Transcript_8788/m.53997 type:complete len:104 (-) Transcript_8788:876-1187(-)
MTGSVVSEASSFCPGNLFFQDDVVNSNVCFKAQGESWTDEERERFRRGLSIYGICSKKLSNFIETRNESQVRAHLEKHVERMVREKLPLYDETPMCRSLCRFN